MFKRFFRRLFCLHEWTNNVMELPEGTDSFGPLNMVVGAKDWRSSASCWGCYKCGKKKLFPYSFIPIRWDP